MAGGPEFESWRRNVRVGRLVTSPDFHALQRVLKRGLVKQPHSQTSLWVKRCHHHAVLWHALLDVADDERVIRAASGNGLSTKRKKDPALPSAAARQRPDY